MKQNRELTNGEAFLAAVLAGAGGMTGAAGILAALGKVNPMVVEAILRAFGVL